jgi:hypothetical protein
MPAGTQVPGDLLRQACVIVWPCEWIHVAIFDFPFSTEFTRLPTAAAQGLSIQERWPFSIEIANTRSNFHVVSIEMANFFDEYQPVVSPAAPPPPPSGETDP